MAAERRSAGVRSGRTAAEHPEAVPGATRRLAALVALAAPVVALAASIEVTVAHSGNLVFLVLSIAAVTVAVWYALTRRGVLRTVAVSVAVLAAAAVVLVGLSLFLLQTTLLVVFAAAGRHALGRDAASLAGNPWPVRAVEPARNGVLLINPKSGNAAAIRLNLATEAAGRGIRVITAAPGDDLAELAEQAVADGADVLGMAGGDGSQAIVAATAVRHGIAHVCVPSGTRNHFALDLGLDRGDVVGALDAFTDGVERVVDNPYQLTRLGRAGGRPRMDSGRLGILAARVRGAAGNQQVTSLRRFADVLEWSRNDFELRSAAPVPVGIDGEALILTPPLRFTSLPGVLRVRLPRLAATRQVRRNAALTHRDLTALVRILRGRRAAPIPGAGGSSGTT
jgi:diacylglycerol kinase family enzyme